MENWGERNTQRNVPFSITEYKLLPTIVLPVACAKVWELCVKAKFSITEEDASRLWKARLCQTFFIYFGRSRGFGLYKSCSRFLFFPQKKKKRMLALICTQREQNKREQRKWREGVTDSGNGRLGPEEQCLVKCSCTQSPLLKRAHTELGLPKGSMREK